ncbi:Calx-beta domain-containing protein [Sphingomonas sp. Leaf226]|uniref:Calx-beta domain-containing protein n=1 Tax=Sphingomonas sp. Leaf226 TaxID=1735691 RepID=UPI0006FA4EE4|nr:hypothetical protein [Sphingomonas sp. Leaf226]KQM99428.1 hypothetical protein ASE77_00060 [Sphingomonas sp. Leaf226]
MPVLSFIPNNTSARDWRDTFNALIKRIAVLEAAGVAVPTPAPAFTVQPSISPTSGTAGATLFAVTPGTVSDGAVVARVWLLNGTAISSGVTALPASSGTLAYQETASGPGGTTTSTVQVAAVTAATVTPTPAPSFTSQPSISPNSGTAGVTTFTATAGNISNGSITSRSWAINGAVISTGLTASPASSGTLTYQETATGSGGTTQSTVQQVTVASSSAAAPAFTSQPTVSPSTGTAGTTTYTATPGTVSNGTITSRAWSLNGSTISTGLTATPASGGTLTYQEFATGSGGSASSSILTRTVSAAILSSLIVQIGDSIPLAARTSGYSAIKNMGYDSSLVTIDNTRSQDGHSLAQIAADVPGGLSSVYVSSKRCIAIIQRVTNDFGNDKRSAADCIALTKAQVNLLRSQGFYVGVGTCLPRTVGSFGWVAANETERQTYNAWVVANTPVSGYAGHDFVLDFAGDSVMGASNAPNNTALYSDGTHPTAAGQDYLMPIYREAVRPFLTMAVRTPTPLVTISGAVSQNEGNSGTTSYTYTVTRTAPGTAINVPWVFAAGTTNAADFAGGTLPAGGTLAFASGDTTKAIVIGVNGDAVSEATEQFTVTLQPGAGYTLGSPSSATGTVVDDDSGATTWAVVNDYTPSGGPIAAGAAGTAPNAGGWIDVYGAKWSVDDTNRFIGVPANPGFNTVAAKSPMASAVNSRLTMKFVLGSGQTAIEVLLRYANPSGTSTTAYGVAINAGFGTGTAAIIASKIVANTKATLASSSANSSAPVAGTTYVLVASVYSASDTSTAIDVQLYQEDGITPVSGASISIAADTTTGLQAGVTGGLGVWVFKTVPIFRLTSETR